MQVMIKRQKAMDTEPYWQTFLYRGELDVTVAAVLECLNSTENLCDIDGQPAEFIRWSCSCMQNVCGACAMVINGRPAMACNTFLRDLNTDRLVLEPLSKFPTVTDLLVDRNIIYENLKAAELYLGEYEPLSAKAHAKQEQQLYSAGKCMKCGLCLEVCPNFSKGQKFFGAQFANEVYLLHSQSKDRKKQLIEEYREHFASGCSKALSCQAVCPAGISTLSAILTLNRR